MLKRSSTILSVVIGIVALFLVGCSKDGHDTIIHLGDESYKSPLDSIYPKRYRDLWKTIASSCSDTVYDGLFPPDVTGLYEIEGLILGSDVEYTEGSPAPYSAPQKRYYYFLIEDQINGIAKLKFCTRSLRPLPKPYDYDSWYSIDTVYIWGCGDEGLFSICFDNVFPTPSSVSYNQGFVFNGRISESNDNSKQRIVSDIEVWYVYKNRNQIQDIPNIIKIGGQECYYAEKLME